MPFTIERRNQTECYSANIFIVYMENMTLLPRKAVGLLDITCITC